MIRLLGGLSALLLSLHGYGHAPDETTFARLSKLMEAAPDSQSLNLQRAALQIRSGHLAEAEQDLAQAARLGDSRQTGLQRGLLAMARSDHHMAIAPLTDYLLVHPDDPTALLNRARARTRSGETEAAWRDYEAFFRVSSQPQPGDYIAAATLLDATGDTEPALNLLDEGLTTLGKQPQLLRMAIELDQRLGRLSAALERSSALGVLLRHSGDWALTHARLLAANGQGDERQQVLERARNQLRNLRPTPARQALLARLEQALSRRAAPLPG